MLPSPCGWEGARATDASGSTATAHSVSLHAKGHHSGTWLHAQRHDTTNMGTRVLTHSLTQGGIGKRTHMNCSQASCP